MSNKVNEYAFLMVAANRDLDLKRIERPEFANRLRAIKADAKLYSISVNEVYQLAMKNQASYIASIEEREMKARS